MKKNTKHFRYSVITSVTALILIFVLAVGFTFSWSEGGDKGYIDGNQLVINTGSNLTMRQDGKTTSSITIPTRTLYEASSADGLNYFFPLAGNKTNLTDTMTFREGTTQDVNQRYLSLDFELEAGGSPTNVYLGSGTIIKCSNPAVLDALRMSFNTNDGKVPVVFKPSQMPGIEMEYSPIVAISPDGQATTKNTDSYAYGDYYYKGDANDSNYLFHLEKEEIKNITLSIWLEGTAFGDHIDSTFTNTSLDNGDFSVFIDFTTYGDDLVNYNFIDNTRAYDTAETEYWVSNKEDIGSQKYITMMYIFDVNTQRYYAMTKTKPETYDNSNPPKTVTGSEWSVYVPSAVKSFTFRRYSIDLDRCWNEWVPDLNSSVAANTYVAVCGVRGYNQDAGWEANVGPCGGYWQDAYKTIRVFCEVKNSSGWGDPNCYAWTSKNTWPLGATPGKKMNYCRSTSDSKIFFIDISVKDGTELHGIQFNNSNNTGEKFDISHQTYGNKYFFSGLSVWCESSSKYGFYIYDDVLNNPLWNSATIYVEPRKYSDGTLYGVHYLYAYDDDDKNIHNWHGDCMYYDEATGYYKISLLIDHNYNIIVNDNGNTQYPGNGSSTKLKVEPGKSYLLKNNNSFTEYYP